MGKCLNGGLLKIYNIKIGIHGRLNEYRGYTCTRSQGYSLTSVIYISLIPNIFFPEATEQAEK